MPRVKIHLGFFIVVLFAAWLLHVGSALAKGEEKEDKFLKALERIAELPSQCMKGCYDVFEVQMSSCEKQANGAVKDICEGNAFETYQQCMKDCKNLADGACQDQMVVHLKVCDEVVGTKEKCEKRALATNDRCVARVK